MIILDQPLSNAEIDTLDAFLASDRLDSDEASQETETELWESTLPALP